MPKTCNFGGIHGVYERYTSANKGSLLDKNMLITLCGENQSTCAHILGHLLLVETGNNLDKAKGLCTIFPKKNEQLSDCLQGVYMEYMIGSNLFVHGLISEERRTNWYKLFDEFEKLCRSATGEEARACWGVIIHPATPHFNNDPERILAFCNTAQTQGAAAYCRRYTIAQTSIVLDFDFPKFRAICDSRQPDDPLFRADCYTTLIKTATANLSAKEQKKIVDFCASLSEMDQARCLQIVRDSFTRLSVDKNHAETVCSYISSKFTSVCIHAD